MTLDRENHYCSSCRKTTSFLVLPGGVLSCVECNGQLHPRSPEDQAKMRAQLAARDPWEPTPGVASDQPLQLREPGRDPAPPVFGPQLPPARKRPGRP